MASAAAILPAITTTYPTMDSPPSEIERLPDAITIPLPIGVNTARKTFHTTMEADRNALQDPKRKSKTTYQLQRTPLPGQTMVSSEAARLSTVQPMPPLGRLHGLANS